MSAAYRWEYACGHITEGGSECADACPECGERDLRRKTPVAASRQPFHERFWWLPVATVAAGCLGLTGVLAWLAYFGAWSHA